MRLMIIELINKGSRIVKKIKGKEKQKVRKKNNVKEKEKIYPSNRRKL